MALAAAQASQGGESGEQRHQPPEEVLGLGCEEAAQALCPVSACKGRPNGQNALYPLGHLAKRITGRLADQSPLVQQSASPVKPASLVAYSYLQTSHAIPQRLAVLDSSDSILESFGVCDVSIIVWEEQNRASFWRVLPSAHTCRKWSPSQADGQARRAAMFRAASSHRNLRLAHMPR